MRTLRIVLLLVSRALTGGAMLAAQAVERTDVPARGVLRVTFDPRIMTWNDEFTAAGRLKLGAPLTGDTVGGRYIPVVARLEQNVRGAGQLGALAWRARCAARRRVRCGADRLAVPAARHVDRRPGHRQRGRADPAGLGLDIRDRRVRYHRRARTGHAQRRRVRADPPQPRSEWVRVCQRAVHAELPLPIGRRGACREVPARGRRALRRRAAGGGAPADGSEGFGQRTAHPEHRRPPAGPRRTADAGAIGRTALAQCGRPRGDAAAGDAGAPGRAVGRVSGSGRGHRGPAVGSWRLRGSVCRAAGAPRAGIRGRGHGGLLLEAARSLRVSIAAGLGRPRDSHGIRDAGQRARRGHRTTLAPPRLCDDVSHAGGRGRVLDRADRQRRWARPGGDDLSAGAAGDTEAFLSSSAAWLRAVRISGSPSMRASSRVRASPVTTWTSLVAIPPRAPLATTRW